MSNLFSVSLVCWHDGEPLLRSVREAVFIHEQGIPAELEWDGWMTIAGMRLCCHRKARR